MEFENMGAGFLSYAKCDQLGRDPFKILRVQTLLNTITMQNVLVKKVHERGQIY